MKKLVVAENNIDVELITGNKELDDNRFVISDEFDDIFNERTTADKDKFKEFNKDDTVDDDNNKGFAKLENKIELEFKIELVDEDIEGTIIKGAIE